MRRTHCLCLVFVVVITYDVAAVGAVGVLNGLMLIRRRWSDAVALGATTASTAASAPAGKGGSTVGQLDAGRATDGQDDRNFVANSTLHYAMADSL